MRKLVPILVVLLFSCSSKTSKQSESLRALDTLSNGLRIINTLDSPFFYKDRVGTYSLKGGYELVYAGDDSAKHLFLKNDKTLSLINKTIDFTSLYHLGIPINDEETFLILGHDQGNGSPYSYEFIDKLTGKNVLGYGKTFLDFVDQDSAIYLLQGNIFDSEDSLLALFNVKTGSKEFYGTTSGYTNVLIDTITAKEIKLECWLDRYGKIKKTKLFNRELRAGKH